MGAGTTSHAAAPSLPTFCIVGAQKAGTTSLWAYLRSHPQVFLSDVKEPGFFCEEITWSRGPDWYGQLFAGAGDAIAVGEASTYYTMYPYFAGVPERMASMAPGLKIIYVVRDPIDRMRSAYVQLVSDGSEKRSMRVALLLDSRYVVLSRYAFQLDQYRDWFPESNILVLTAEELRDRRDESLQRVCRFIGVDDKTTPDSGGHYNASAGKRALRPAGRILRRIAVDERTPEPARARLFRTLRSSVTSRPIEPEELAVDDDLRSRLVALLRDDVDRLRKWMDPSFDGWGLLDSR
jgi:hypothetical protein